MTITEATVHHRNADDADVLAYCSVTFDGALAVHDLRVVRSRRTGALLVVFPSARIADRCPECAAPIPRGDKFCGWCGRPAPRPGGRRNRRDVAHPIDPGLRAAVEAAVLEALAAFDAGRGGGEGSAS